MMSTSFAYLLCLASVALYVSAVPLSQVGMSWADSYSIGGACYCKSTYDHDIGSVKVTGPNGKQITVMEACALVGSGPEHIGSERRIYYNSIQCGHGPYNDAGDETACPGRVDLGYGNQSGCMAKGPKWRFPSKPSAPATQGPVLLKSATVPTSRNIIASIAIMDVKTKTSRNIRMDGSNIVVRAKYPNGFAIVVKTSKTVQTVSFSTTGYHHVESIVPYVMNGNSGSLCHPWDAAPGSHVVTITAKMAQGLSETKKPIFIIQ